MDERALFGFLVEIVAKAGNLLSCVGALGRPSDQMKVIEMSLNKTDIMLEKSKILIMKLDKIFVIVPFSLAKIEIRMRNVIINMRPKFEAIQRFAVIFLALHAEQAKIEKKAEAAWIQEMKQKEAEQNAQKKQKKQASVVPFDGAGKADGGNEDGLEENKENEHQ